MDEVKNQWFEDWFDSDYYHILYQNRDEREAQHFIEQLIEYLGFNAEDNILDIPCGKGRHSLQIHNHGYKVTGADLSFNSISKARKFENEKLQFRVHDMREPVGEACFDYVLNLFTSFGYFQSDEENIKVLKAFKESLKKGGTLVVDFMNTEKVVESLVPYEEKILDGIEFVLKRKLENGFIIKEIHIHDQGRLLSFKEEVRALAKADFLQYFKKAGLELIKIFGNYNLDLFVPEASDRMIFILKKS